MQKILVWIAVFGGLNCCLNAQAEFPKCHPYVKHFSAHPASATPWTVPSLCKAYNFPTRVGGNGVIGILEFGGGWTQADLDRFSQSCGMPKIVVQNVSLDGTKNNPGADPSADVEVALDIQCAAGAYYYATGTMPKIFVFFSNGDFPNTFSAATTAQCDVLSISWGLDERSWKLQAPGLAQVVEAAAQNATAAGLAIFAAAGDNSSSDADTGTNVDMPASCPHIVACGGTSKTSTSEKVWGDGVATHQGTGGGYSAIFPAQTFQIGAPKGPAGLGRMVPDIAADADPNTGMIIFSGGHEYLVGGTSAVAPLYSGLFAAIGKRLGYVTPTLRKNPKAFVDITDGSNGAYRATIGPDPCTGLGVANGAAVASLFALTTPQNVVAVNYNTTTKTLTLTGDGANNTINMTKSGANLQLTTTGGTTMTLSTNSGTAGPKTTSGTVTGLSGDLIIQGNLSDGNDSVSLTSISITTLTLSMGGGNDAVSASLCTIGTCAVDGGPGTDTFTATGTKITKNLNTNIP